MKATNLEGKTIEAPSYWDELLTSAELRRQRQRRNMAMFQAIVWLMFFLGVMATGVIGYKIFFWVGSQIY